jgi:hypothetical protein
VVRGISSLGHQLNLYINEQDTRDLEKAVGCLGECHFIHSRASIPSPRVVDSLLFREAGVRWLFLYIVRKTDLESVKLRARA